MTNRVSYALYPDDHSNVGKKGTVVGLIHRGTVALLAVVLCAAATFASAGNNTAAPSAQHAGLMWNRSGLPAVFPLQIKTLPGQDYFLTLNDVKGKAVLAAYIIGGAFFKVLVPPGVFRLKFAAGDVWQGEDNLFGPGDNTHFFELRAPLSFETRGLGIKAGHVVSLLERPPGQIAAATLRDQLICQSVRSEFPSSIYSLGAERAQDGQQRWRPWIGDLTNPNRSIPTEVVPIPWTGSGAFQALLCSC